MPNAPIIDVERFVGLAISSGLLDRDQLNAVRSTAGAETVDDLCNALTTQGMLTDWQCGKLRNGQYKGFFFERQYKLTDRIGDDGESSRYLAIDLYSQSEVALRIYPPDGAGRHRCLVEEQPGHLRKISGGRNAVRSIGARALVVAGATAIGFLIGSWIGLLNAWWHWLPSDKGGIEGEFRGAIEEGLLFGVLGALSGAIAAAVMLCRGRRTSRVTGELATPGDGAAGPV